MLVGMCADNAGMQQGSTVEIQWEGGVQLEIQMQLEWPHRDTPPPAGITI